MSWTDERVSVLKNLWAEGLSASQIAKQLGGGVTRNAVIGKVHRLGLAGRATPSRPPKRPVRMARPRNVASPTPRARTATTPSVPLVPAAPPLEPLRREDGSVTTVLNLNERTCKWPIGDPAEQGFAFCGRQSCAGPYCTEHARLAYQPQQAKKKRTYGEPDELRRMMRLAAM
jgi:GcrA cell cycle regulator